MIVAVPQQTKMDGLWLVVDTYMLYITLMKKNKKKLPGIQYRLGTIVDRAVPRSVLHITYIYFFLLRSLLRLVIFQ